MKEEKELSYLEKIKIISYSIDKVKNYIKNYIKSYLEKKNKMPLKKVSFRLVGPSGVGKTEICFQIAKELSEELNKPFETIKIHTPVFSRDDFLVPFPNIDKENSFKMLLSDFFPREKNSCGIYIIDEFSRGDSTLQQLLWQIQNEHRLHLNDLPENWFVICTDNPDESIYNLEMFEDAAGLRRVIHMGVSVSNRDFLKYARENNIHPHIINYIQAFPNDLYDFEAQRQGAINANPASWHKLSDFLWILGSNGKINIDDIEIFSNGLINTQKTEKFLDFIKNQDIITPEDIVYNYDKFKEKIEEFTRNNNSPVLISLLEEVAYYLLDSEVKLNKKIIKNLVGFLTTVPLDAAASFFNMFDDNKGSFLFLTEFNNLANNEPEYLKLMEKLETEMSRISFQ